VSAPFRSTDGAAMPPLLPVLPVIDDKAEGRRRRDATAEPAAACCPPS